VNLSVTRKFLESIRWNTAEGVLCNGLLFIHHLLLFNAIPAPLFGQAGSAIALVYLLATLSSAGFYAILGPSFHYWCSCKQKFLHCVGPHIGGTVLVSLLFIFTASIITAFSTNSAARWVTIGATLCSEAVRETLKATAQTIFANRAHTTINLAALACYCIIVWSCYLWYGTLTFFSLITPLFVTSVLANVALAYTISNWFNTGSEKGTSEPISQVTLLKHRVNGTLYSISTLPFNSNLLIPALALRVGFADVATLKLASDATHYLGNLMRKALYAASHSLFTHSRTANGHVSYRLWLHSNRVLRQMLLLYIPLCIVAALAVTFSNGLYLLPIIGAFGLLKIGECIAAPCETRYLVEAKAHILLSIGLASLTAVATLSMLPGTISTVLLLYIIAAIRFISCIALQHMQRYCTQKTGRKDKTIHAAVHQPIPAQSHLDRAPAQAAEDSGYRYSQVCDQCTDHTVQREN